MVHSGGQYHVTVKNLCHKKVLTLLEAKTYMHDEGEKNNIKYVSKVLGHHRLPEQTSSSFFLTILKR